MKIDYERQFYIGIKYETINFRFIAFVKNVPNETDYELSNKFLELWHIVVTKTFNVLAHIIELDVLLTRTRQIKTHRNTSHSTN